MNQEKNNFLLGLVSGVAAVALIGFIIMSAAYFQKDGKSSDSDNNGNQVAGQEENNNNNQPAGKVDIKVSDADHIRGNKNAPITIVEYSDIQCPFCSRFHDTMRQVMDAYPNDVRWVYKHFPLDSLHPFARKAAEGSECADEQGKFWEYLDHMVDNQDKLSNDYISTAAGLIGLDTSKFDACMESGKYASKVNDQFNEGRGLGVTGTPASFINGELVVGAQPFATLQEKIENLK